ncbi:MAG: DUF4340 domain-containing protein [Saprospiraceae bacterium]|nr:DUF4340 domain-containing protein [Saprospiraceae bacterium]
MNNKKLLFILIALGLIFLFTQLFNQKKERSFKSELVALDTSAITRIILNPNADGQKEIILEKTGNQWTGQQGKLKVPAVEGSLEGILRELVSIKVKSITTQSKDRWKEYEVDDSSGSRVQVFSGNKKLTDFYSGKFGFNPQANSMISYLRLAGEPQVYTIDGFQSMTFNTTFSGFRNKSLIQVQQNDINRIKLNQGNIPQILSKTGQDWTLDGIPVVDSAAVTGYLQGLQNLNGSEIVDEYTPASSADHELQLTTSAQSVTVKIFSSGDSLKPFIMHSSANPEVYFREDSAGAYQSLITGWKTLQSKLVPKK